MYRYLVEIPRLADLCWNTRCNLRVECCSIGEQDVLPVVFVLGAIFLVPSKMICSLRPQPTQVHWRAPPPFAFHKAASLNPLNFCCSQILVKIFPDLSLSYDILPVGLHTVKVTDSLAHLKRPIHGSTLDATTGDPRLACGLAGGYIFSRLV